MPSDITAAAADRRPSIEFKKKTFFIYNPNPRNMKNYYRITAYGCSMYGAVDSAFVVFCAVYGTFVQFIPWQYAAALGIAGVGLIAMAIDYGLMVGLQTFFGRYYDGVTGTHKRLIMGWSLLFLLIQVFGTMGLTMYGRKYVTDAVTTPPKMEQADMSEPNRYADLVKEQREQLERLKSAERKELAAAVVNPQLTEAWGHLQAGRVEAAQRLYQQVNNADPRNIDALLGLAAIAQLAGQPEQASRLYLRALEVEPRNAHAQAALLGVVGRVDPAAAESQLKQLISREPAPFLFFTLGNLYADQNRWPLAQQAWFQAHHLAPDNADYAFNLAVGLERINQPRLALDYLRTAIRLAESSGRANFDVGAARGRARLLEQSASAN